MTFTYDKTSLTSSLAQVRRTIGDVDADDPLLTDEEINWRLGQTSNVLKASTRCLTDILAEYHKRTDTSAQGINTSRSQRFSQLKDLLKDLRGQIASTGIAPLSTAGSKARQATIESDTDYEQPEFYRGMDDLPGSIAGDPE